MEKTSLVLSFCLLVLLFTAPVQPEQGATTTTTTVVLPTTRIPSSIPEIPASTVSYDFAGDEGESVCVILTPETTAEIRACSSNADLKFSTNLSRSVPIKLVQTRDASRMCQLLIITTSIDNLQEGAFDVFYNSNSLQIKYGPLRLSNPNGDHVLPFGNGITEVVLRYRPVDRTRTEFQVCRNGTLADFVVRLRQSSDCRLGTGAGGFSSHFDAIVSDIGQDPLSGENFTITSGPCNNTAAGISFNFSVPEKVFSSTVIIPSTPSLTPSPTSAIISTVPSPTSPIPTPGHSNTIVIAVTVTVIVVVVLGIGVAILLAIICTPFIRKRTHRSNELGCSDQVDAIENSCTALQKSPEQSNSERNGKLPNREASPVFRKLTEKVDELSKGVEENRKKVDDNSTKVEENSIKLEKTCNEVEENSIKLEKMCKEVEETNIKIEKTNKQVEENTKTVGNLQKEMGQEKLKAFNTQQRLDELENTEVENILSEQQDQETEVEDHRGSNHTH